MAGEGSRSYWGKGLVEENRRRAGLSPLQSSFLPLSKTAIMCFREKNVRIIRADKRARTYISGDSSQLSSSLNNEVPELISSQKLSPYFLVYWVVRSLSRAAGSSLAACRGDRQGCLGCSLRGLQANPQAPHRTGTWRELGLADLDWNAPFTEETTHLPLLHSLSHFREQKFDYNSEGIIKQPSKGQSPFLFGDFKAVRKTDKLYDVVTNLEFSYSSYFSSSLAYFISPD